MPEDWTYHGFSPTPLPVAGKIIPGIDDGKIALPEFQRDFDWSPKKEVVSLLTSVARRWPIGTLLIRTGERVAGLDWGRRRLEGAPPLNAPDTIVLDGQQRLTSLYHAIRDISDDVYYCHIDRVIGQKQLDDEDIVSEKRTRFDKSYPDIGVQASNGLIKIKDLFSDELFDEWLSHVPEDRRREFHRARNGPLAGLRSGNYSLHAIELQGEVPLDVVAKIFETTNRNFLKLGAFDLMVARLYPKEFNLREEWEAAKARFGNLGDMEGLEALQVLALREHLRQSGDASGRRIRGIRESDVLDLDADTVIQDWQQAIEALSRAVDFVADQCGAIRSNLIPADAMLIPLADQLWDERGSRVREVRLRRWFWVSTMNQTYAQGANTQAVTDARELRDWVAKNKEPERMAAKLPDSLEESLRDTQRRNKMLTRGLLCLLVRRDARDWMSTRSLKEEDGNIEIQGHHAFPGKYVETSWSGPGSVVANYAPLTKRTNQSLRSDHPSAVVKRRDVIDKSIWTSCIPQAEFISDNWPAFIERRVEMLMEAFRDELDR